MTFKKARGYKMTGLKDYFHDENHLTRRERILELYKGIRGKILDIGCGDGFISAEFVDKEEVYGVDNFSDILKVASERGIITIKADLERGIPFKENIFDCVIASEILEHIFNTDFVIGEIRRVLKTNGHLIVSVPNVCCFTSRANVIVGRLPCYIEYDTSEGMSGHIRGYNKSAILNQLKRHGFQIEDVRTNMLIIPVLRWRINWKFKAFSGLGEIIIVKARKRRKQT